MNIRNSRLLIQPTVVALAVVLAGSACNLRATTNGFLVPPIRGTANSESGYWEVFSVPTGAPGNLPDQPGATTTAVLTQNSPGAILTSGNIYNPSTSNTFTIQDTAPFVVGTVVLQARTLGNPLDYNSVALTFTDDAGAHTLMPLFRYELSRAGGGVSSLWQWDLSGFNVSSYSIAFNGSAAHVSLDAVTLDATATGTNFLATAAFPQQPFRFQSQPATISRWSYLASDYSSTTRPVASIFGALGNAPDFDSRDAQYLLGWNTTSRVPTGQGANNYLIRRARVTLTIASADTYQYTYTSHLRDYRSYFPANDPRYVASPTTNSAVELYGVGFRGGFTNEFNAYEPWAATNYPQGGPWAANANGGYATNRVAYAAGFNRNGALVDVSNNVGDNGMDEIAAPFEVAPFAVGTTTDVAEGEPMPTGGHLTFDLNLDDPLIYSYLQKGLNEGNLSFMVSSLANAVSQSPPFAFPCFYTLFSPLAGPGDVPLLDLEGEIVRPNFDADANGLPDDWENFLFGSLANSATGDADGDGISNLAEYQAGTNPNAATNLFHLLSLRHETNVSALRFTFAPGRQYNIRWSDDLAQWQTLTNPPLTYSSAWLEKSVPNPVYPSPVFAEWQDACATNQARFYRAEAHY